MKSQNFKKFRGTRKKNPGRHLTMAEIRRRQWLRRTLVRKHGGVCALCGKPVLLQDGHADSASIDHIRPVSKGGADTIENMQLAHERCNRRKGDRYDDSETR